MAEVLATLMEHPHQSSELGRKTQRDILNRFGMGATLQALKILWEQ